jgi:hypothetical protein
MSIPSCRLHHEQKLPLLLTLLSWLEIIFGLRLGHWDDHVASLFANLQTAKKIAEKRSSRKKAAAKVSSLQRIDFVYDEQWSCLCHPLLAVQTATLW